MAGASRRGYGEDGIYFDHRGDCRDSALHKTCTGRWRGVVSLGFDADGKRLRRKVSGQTKAEVKDKLRTLHSELDALAAGRACAFWGSGQSPSLSFAWVTARTCTGVPSPSWTWASPVVRKT